MKISTIIISLMVVGIIFVGMYGFLDGLADSNSYNVNYDSKYKDSFNKIEDVSENISLKYDAIQRNLSASKSDTIGIVTLVPDIMIIVIDIVSAPFLMASDILTFVTSELGLPSWVITFLYGILVIIVVFGLISLILRFRET